jgi:hypothetical protein
MDSSRQACSRAAREHSAALAWRLSLASRSVSVSQCYCIFDHYYFSTITASSSTTTASTSASAATSSTSVTTYSTAPLGPGPRRLASSGASFLGRCRYSLGAEPVRARRTEECAARSPVWRRCTIKAAIPRASFVITYYTSYRLPCLYHARAVPDL